MNEKVFIDEMKKLGYELTNEQLNQLETYYNLLVEWNEKINLTSITKKEEVYLKHFYDSATVIRAIDLTKEKNLCDIGTGAGFPGIVIKILYPNLDITLVDSLNKRIKFLNVVIEQLNLKQIKAIHFRAEEYSNKNRELFDVVISRAVGHLSLLLEYSIPLVKVNKYLISMKGNISREILESENALNKLKSKIDKIEEFELPIEESSRNILVVKKLEKTPNKYPRQKINLKLNKL